MRVLIVLSLFALASSLEFRYHSHEEIRNILRDYEKGARDFNASLYSIGKSVQGAPGFGEEDGGDHGFSLQGGSCG